MIYRDKFFRNPLTGEQQGLIKGTRFAIVGLGGTGGFILENLVRLGAERFIVFEPDRIELSNFNRQMLATEPYIDRQKAAAAKDRAASINGSVELIDAGLFSEGSDLSDAAILLDGADTRGTKLAMARAARAKSIPYVFCSASGARGMVSVFTDYSFEKAFQVSGGGDAPACREIMCPAAALAGTLAASQALNYIIGEPNIIAPEALFFDLFSERVFWRAELG